MRQLLRRLFKHEDIGWKPIGETFYRYDILKTKWFNLYLHELDAPNWHPHCHDHPWWFVTLLLWRGYIEETVRGTKRHYPGSILYRPAEFSHNVITKGVSWSFVLTGPKSRTWMFGDCHD